MSLMDRILLKSDCIPPDLVSTLSYFVQCLCNLNKYDEFKNWLDNLIKLKPLLFEKLKKNEDFVFYLINLRIYEENFCEVYELIKNGTFTKPERFILLWDKAHYKLKEKEKGFPLTPLARFRVRKKFPPPKSICPTGQRPTSNLPEQARQILRQWFDKNVDNPYPNNDEKKQLVEQSGLLLSQVKTWFANTRRRRKVALNQTYKSSIKPRSQNQKIIPNYYQLSCSERLTNIESILDTSMKKVGLYPNEEISEMEILPVLEPQDQCLFKVKEDGNSCKECMKIVSEKMLQNQEEVHCLENNEVKMNLDAKDSHGTRNLDSALLENSYPVLQAQQIIVPKGNNYYNAESEQNEIIMGNVCNSYNLFVDGEFPDNFNILQDCVEFKCINSDENNFSPNRSNETIVFNPSDTTLMTNINPAVPDNLWSMSIFPTDCLTPSTNQNLAICYDQTSQWTNNIQSDEDPNIHNIKLSATIPNRNNSTTIILVERKEPQACVPQKRLEEEIAQVLLNLSTV